MMLSPLANMFGLLVMLVATPAAVGLAVAKPQQIRSDSSPVFHFYLQRYKETSLVVLGPAATGEFFNIGGTIQSTNSSLYINIGADTTSYKTLSFGQAATTTAWGLEGDTIITSTSSTYGRQLNFVACKMASDANYWQVYFQTGSAMPSGTCSNYQSLHLPCLC